MGRERPLIRSHHGLFVIEGVSRVKHFFYAVYVLFYTGAVFMAGIFIGQMLYRSRASRRKQTEVAAWSGRTGSNGEVEIGQPMADVSGKRQ